MYDILNINDLVKFTKTLKVLYVEDNQEAREAFKGLLSNFFDSITICVDGIDGLKTFKNDSFDLIISDIRMPKMDGIDMIKEIRKDDTSITIIVATAYKDTELLIDCIKNGVDGYLLKPINYNQLKQTIKQSCEKIYYKNKHLEYESSLEELVQNRTKELEETKDKLIDMVNKDYLTGLYNRRYFHDISKTLFELLKRENCNLSSLMIDIDRFKSVNDNYGHMIGDKVLKQLSTILLELTRQSDVVVRFGGEEFFILLPSTSIEGALIIAKKIRKTIENVEMIIKNNTILKFTVSIGVTQANFDIDKNIDSIVYRADEALYKAKDSGRNRVVVSEKKII